MSTWQESDQSSDEFNQGTHSTARKRSSRACDQCRKTKSKCERQSNAHCKSCVSAGTSCTFLGPSYKRGPPKGYIHAIEQRWQQVESLLGVILSCPDARAQSIVNELRKDELAREIIRRVECGPFGPAGRLNRGDSPTKEDFFAAIIRGGETSPLRENPRSRRQSRVSREIVSSSQDTSLSFIPTAEWQTRLSERLAASGALSKPLNAKGSCPTFDPSGTPLVRRRRLDLSPEDPDCNQPNWNEMYTMDDGSTDDDDEFETAAEMSLGIGQLSLDENHEVRFLGKTSGLHLLRTDPRQEGRAWVWPHGGTSPADSPAEGDLDLEMPPPDVQARLIDLYFEYVHPAFPVIHKDSFMASYMSSVRMSQSGKLEGPSPARPGSTRGYSKVLLLSMFAIAARYCDDEMPNAGRIWEAGCGFLDQARQLWSKVFHRSQLSTCQALLLLGYREFGLGCMEQGWIYIGTAIRIALDLGLNRNSNKWQINGEEVFSAEQKQERQQIWWACCIADKHCSVFMGRPVAIRDDDFDTQLPEIDRDEEEMAWHSPCGDPMNGKAPQVPAKTIICFRASASLSVIVGSIAMGVYPVRTTTHAARRAVLAQLARQLEKWHLELPECLQYPKAVTPPPHILLLHVSYWGAVLLLHRAFLPRTRPPSPHRNRKDSDTSSMRAIDTCQTAANRISTIVNVHLDRFDLNHCSPLLSSYILSAGIMHVATLTLRPSNPEASLGLHQCLTALGAMVTIWPGASHAWELLNNAQIRPSDVWTQLENGSDRRKRPADTAFGNDKELTASPPHVVESFDQHGLSPSGTNGTPEESARLMAQMLGIDIPGVEPSTSYVADWWHRGENAAQPPSESPLSHSSMHPFSSPNAATFHSAQTLSHDWLQGPPARSNYSFDPIIANQYGL